MPWTTCKIRHHVFTTFDARIRNVKYKNRKNVLEVLKSSKYISLFETRQSIKLTNRRCSCGKQQWRKSCRNSNCTFCRTIKLSSCFERINKLDHDHPNWPTLSHSFASWNIAWHWFYPIDPKARARAKMAGIVTKVYQRHCGIISLVCR